MGGCWHGDRCDSHSLLHNYFLCSWIRFHFKHPPPPAWQVWRHRWLSHQRHSLNIDRTATQIKTPALCKRLQAHRSSFFFFFFFFKRTRGDSTALQNKMVHSLLSIVSYRPDSYTNIHLKTKIVQVHITGFGFAQTKNHYNTPAMCACVCLCVCVWACCALWVVSQLLLHHNYVFLWFHRHKVDLNIYRTFMVLCGVLISCLSP